MRTDIFHLEGTLPMTETPRPPDGDPNASQPGGAYGAPGEPSAPGAGYPPPAGPDAGAYDTGGAYGTGVYAEAAPVATKRGPGRGVMIGVGATVLAVVAGAAVYATTQLSGGGRQPDELAPKSTFAYAKLDLDPAANQKLAAREFFGKFPSLKKPSGDEENVFESLLAQMFEGEENFKYETDVKPWFNKRVGIAGFRASSGPTAVVIIQSKDDEKARKAMDKAVAEAKKDDDEFAYKIEKGYVVVGDTQAHVDEAVTQSKQGSIKDNPTYKDDIDRLDGDQVAVAWVDLAQVFDVVKNEIPDAGLIPNAITDQLKGRFVAGLHMDGDYAEMTGYMIGVPQQGTPPPANEAKLLKNLPSGTIAAVSVNGLGEGVKQSLNQLGTLGMDPEQFIGPFLQELGLSLDNDILPLLGDQAVVSLGGLPTGPEDVAAGLVSTVKDPASAKTSGSKIAAALTDLGVPVQADVQGNTFYLATESYLPSLKSGSGGLGGVEKFSKAMGDLGAVSSAAYVDLEAVVGAFGMTENPDDVKALKSVGIVSGYDKNTPFFRVRVVAL
jgi:hypothetical protein